MTTPTIHLNGTPQDRLLEQLTDLSNALEAAYQAMKQAAPNARDYYPQGPHALECAINEHTDRMRRLDGIKQEVDALAIAVCDAA